MCGGNGHSHYNFVVSPLLPDNISGIKLIFKEYSLSRIDETIDNEIVIEL
ncbi:hypothetical protein [Clostridium saccharobutylicum]|nr:hypothetical protein [Clostridium saccharobutylicum]MBA2904523.1 hypothetical protein [Clostridium saccharobutylicum]MBA8895539.1 hypothetical protein [Clostridium saccharobutylicum]MBA8981742.1 hypothetical protein [Clostridium saccharobutylicum]MBA9000001.1 hypothetical protein [Clostridium saccharobutylicum]MBA9011473.1 hypothetical protein [Clostridium saccharobutylicum]